MEQCEPEEPKGWDSIRPLESPETRGSCLVRQANPEPPLPVRSLGALAVVQAAASGSSVTASPSIRDKFNGPPCPPAEIL